MSAFPLPNAPQPQPRYSPWEPVFAGRTGTMPGQFVDQFLRSPDETFEPLITGRLTRIWHKQGLGPFFRLLARHGILVASEGTDVPMTLTMMPRVTAQGVPYNVCGRLFEFGSPARWDTIKTWDSSLGRIVEYVGHSARLKVVLETRYDGDREITFSTERIALRVGSRYLWLPDSFWRLLMGTMRFRQVASRDGSTIDIRLSLTQPLVGDVFGYEGRFSIVRSDDLAEAAA